MLVKSRNTTLAILWSSVECREKRIAEEHRRFKRIETSHSTFEKNGSIHWAQSANGETHERGGEDARRLRKPRRNTSPRMMGRDRSFRESHATPTQCARNEAGRGAR